MPSNLTVVLCSLNIIDSTLKFLIEDKGRLGFVQIVQGIIFVCVEHMFYEE